MSKRNNSMYQQGGIVNNKSMAVSKFMGNQSIGQGLQGKSLLGNKSIKKVEGNDFAKTTKTNFEQTINNLKSKPNKKVLQDEYINGLQQQIKYLQYELKLLKDKQIIEREGVNQLDNFLKDQIPINENILAMKNKYNATKAKLQEQLGSLNSKKHTAQEVLATQKGQIDRLHNIIDAHRKQKDQRRQQFKQKLGQIIKQTTISIKQYEDIGSQNKRLQQSIKKMNEQISIIQRQNQKQKVGEVRLAEQKMKKIQKFEQKFKQTHESMIQTTQQCQQLDSYQDNNPLITPLQQQNSNLRKRIMLNQKQKSTADNNIAQIQLFLKQAERQRQIQRQYKNKYLIVGEQCRIQLQQLDRQFQNMIKDQTLRAKKILIKDIYNQLTQKQQVYDLMTDRLRNLQQQCSNLIQQKKQLQDSLEDQIKIQKQIKDITNTTEVIITENRSQNDSLRRVIQEIVNQTTPVCDELQKFKGRIPMVEKQIERKKTSIHYLNKQIDLLKQLKNLDLQHLHMIAQGGQTMQNILHSFIKNWEKIKSQ